MDKQDASQLVISWRIRERSHVGHRRRLS